MEADTHLGLGLHRQSILAGRTGVRRFTNELGSSKRRYTGLRRHRHAAECGFVWSPGDDLAPAPALS